MSQMRLIYCNGFSEDERRETRSIIFRDLLNVFKTVLEVMEDKNVAFKTEVAKVARPMKHLLLLLSHNSSPIIYFYSSLPPVLSLKQILVTW